MSEDQSQTEAQGDQHTETTTVDDTEIEEAAALDIESVAKYQERIDELEELAEAQKRQIEDLQDMMLDLSARAADGRDIGVCPECNGPLVRKDRLFRTDTIECEQCGSIVHRY